MSIAVLEERSTYKFRLNQGHHSINEGTVENPKLKRYRQGDIVESHQRLDLMFNAPGSTKFELLETDIPDTEESLAKEQERLNNRLARIREGKTENAKKSDSLDLDTRTLQELQDIAKANGINIGKAKGREEVLKTVKEAMTPA